MFGKKKVNEAAVDIVLKENKKLKVKIKHLQESLNSIAAYKEQYEKLIEDTKKVQADYKKRLDEFTELENEYKMLCEEYKKQFNLNLENNKENSN